MLPYFWMLCSALAFACMGALGRGLQGMCDWQVVALARAALAALFALALVAAARVPLVVWRPRTLWLRSFAGSISMLCTFYALPRLPIADVLTVANIFPVWIALLSWPLLKERPSAAVWGAIACALAGVALIQQPHFGAADTATFHEARLATLVMLAGSVATAVAMLGLNRLQGIDVRAIVVHFSAVATLFCAAACLVAPVEHAAVDYANATVLLMLLGVGLSATIGQILLTKAFTVGNAAKVSVAALSQIGFAMIFDVVFWGRQITWLSLAGMALVVVPTAWLMWGESEQGIVDTEVDVL